METNYFEIELRSIDDNTIKGVIPYNSKSTQMNEVIKPGAFKNLQDDIKLLFGHESKSLLARRGNNSLTIKDTQKGLYFEARLNPNISLQRDILQMVKDQLLTGVSFGFKDNQPYYGIDGTRELRDLTLKEISLVTFPAYQSSQVRELPTFNLLEAKARQRQLELMELEIKATTPHHINERTRK